MVTRLSVRLVCAGGTVKIAPYGIKATVTGQGMASETRGTARWNVRRHCCRLQ